MLSEQTVLNKECGSICDMYLTRQLNRAKLKEIDVEFWRGQSFVSLRAFLLVRHLSGRVSGRISPVGPCPRRN